MRRLAAGLRGFESAISRAWSEGLQPFTRDGPGDQLAAGLEELLMRLSDGGAAAAVRPDVKVGWCGGYRLPADRRTFLKRVTLPNPISTGGEIYQAALGLLAAREPRRRSARLALGSLD
jgi:hypothetical protein